MHGFGNRHGSIKEEHSLRDGRVRPKALKWVGVDSNVMFQYGIMTEELDIREIRIDEAAGRGDSDSRMTSFEVIMPLKLQSTKILICSI